MCQAVELADRKVGWRHTTCGGLDTCSTRAARTSRLDPVLPGMTAFVTDSTQKASLVMLLVVLLLVSKAGAMCVGDPQELRSGEVMIMCPLSEDARLTKLDVVISHSSHDQSIPDTMLGCVWPERDPLNPDCRSRFNFTLVSLQKDCAMARVPRERLHKDGFYQSQLVPPPDEEHAFSRCLIFDNDDTEDPTTTLSPVIPATDQPWPRDPTDKVLTGDHPRDNSVAVVGLTLAGVSLLVLVVVFVAFMILRHRRHRRTMLQTSVNSLEKEQQPIRMESEMSEIYWDMEFQLRRTESETSENPQAMGMRPMNGIIPTALRRTESETSENPQAMGMRPMYGIIPTVLRRTESETSENPQAMDMRPMYGIIPTVLRSAIAEYGRSRERPSPKELTGEQPKPTNLTETKVLLKM